MLRRKIIRIVNYPNMTISIGIIQHSLLCFPKQINCIIAFSCNFKLYPFSILAVDNISDCLKYAGSVSVPSDTINDIPAGFSFLCQASASSMICLNHFSLEASDSFPIASAQHTLQIRIRTISSFQILFIKCSCTIYPFIIFSANFIKRINFTAMTII